MNSITRLAKQSSPQATKQIKYWSSKTSSDVKSDGSEGEEKSVVSQRVVEFRKKLRATTPLEQLDEHTRHPFEEKEPLKKWPNGVNPLTGEIGGPAGPEPTRYGDWERKGRVTDF